MDSGAESRWAPLARAARIAALIDVVLAAIITLGCLWFGWTSRNEIATALILTALLVTAAGALAARGGGVPSSYPEVAAIRLHGAAAEGPFESQRAMGLLVLAVLAASPLFVLGLLLSLL